MTELTLERLHLLLPPTSIVLDARAVDRDDAIRQAGATLARSGAVGDSYVSAMLERERAISTYVGEGIAMPHATLATTTAVAGDALALLRFRESLDWDGEAVTVVFAVAAQGRRYIALISQIASVLLDPQRASALRTAESADEIYALFA
jgi:PTS system mannitol-specific IIA component